MHDLACPLFKQGHFWLTVVAREPFHLECWLKYDLLVLIYNKIRHPHNCSEPYFDFLTAVPTPKIPQNPDGPSDPAIDGLLK